MILIHNPLGIALLHIINDNEVMKENDLIPWKLNFIWIKILDDVAWCNLNWNSIWIKISKFNSVWIESIELENQLKRNGTQIVTQGIENMFITSIIHDYGVEKKRTTKRHLFIPFKANFKLKYILVGQDY
jgi:hypothetical protein